MCGGGGGGAGGGEGVDVGACFYPGELINQKKSQSTSSSALHSSPPLYAADWHLYKCIDDAKA